MEGNKKFLQDDFEGALAKYNESVQLEQNGSEYLSLAYGNRSSCFEKLKMYRRCLADIQLAKDVNYPERLMWKLDERKVRCMLKMQSETLSPNYSTLNFNANLELPCISNSVRIDVNEHFGRLITATSDIEIGEIVLMEPEYVRLIVGQNNRCFICGKKNMNFVPCMNCAGAMFCSDNCLNNNFHKIECPMLFDRFLSLADDYFALFVLRSVIIGISNFPSINEMIDAVKNFRTTDPYEMPKLRSQLLQYQTFFKLYSKVSQSQIQSFTKIAYYIYHSIMGNNTVIIVEI